MSRAGMATLITSLRQKTAAGSSDVTLAGVTYWSADHLQTELDKQQQTWRYVRLNSTPVLVSGVFEYYDYLVPPELTGELEENAADSGWCVRDSAGGSVSASGYAVNYQAKKITFTANQQGSAYYLDARSYNVNAAAAEVWRMKASFVAVNVSWSSDNHKVEASQEYEHCMRMAEAFASEAGSKYGRFTRVDEL